MAKLTAEERQQIEIALRDLIYQATMCQELERNDDELRAAIKSAETALDIVKGAEFE